MISERRWREEVREEVMVPKREDVREAPRV